MKSRPHARGATFFDSEVDTIFEIGGQDAKYIRLNEGQVFDAAMNEACSAGTGSFVEEQGRKFAGVEDVVHMGRLALEADGGISLGQHCSVLWPKSLTVLWRQGTKPAPSWPVFTTRSSRTTSTVSKATDPWEIGSSAKACPSAPTHSPRPLCVRQVGRLSSLPIPEPWARWASP